MERDLRAPWAVFTARILPLVPENDGGATVIDGKDGAGPHSALDPIARLHGYVRSANSTHTLMP